MQEMMRRMCNTPLNLRKTHRTPELNVVAHDEEKAKEKGRLNETPTTLPPTVPDCTRASVGAFNH